MLELWLVVWGTVVHGMYDWSGSNSVIGLFVPVNESVWEHFKMAYAALILWHLWPTKLKPRGWLDAPLATAVGVLVIDLVITLVFFTIRSLAHEFTIRLSIDIGSYVLGCLIAGQIIRRWKPTSDEHRTFGRITWLCIGTLFAVLTLWPPQLPLFMEGGFGR